MNNHTLVFIEQHGLCCVSTCKNNNTFSYRYQDNKSLVYIRAYVLSTGKLSQFSVFLSCTLTYIHQVSKKNIPTGTLTRVAVTVLRIVANESINITSNELPKAFTFHSHSCLYVYTEKCYHIQDVSCSKRLIYFSQSGALVR